MKMFSKDKQAISIPQGTALEALCISMLQEQQRSRRWANVYKAVMLTITVVFMMAVYSNQYTITQAKLTERQICQEGYSVAWLDENTSSNH